jgi:symplekin
MAAAPASSPAEMLSQLEAARKLALGDPQVYSQVVPGVLPLVGAGAALEVRRWGADFIAECFASPSLAHPQKEQLVADVLPTLRGYLDNDTEDQAVLRSAVQAAASLYPLVFKRMYV